MLATPESARANVFLEPTRLALVPFARVFLGSDALHLAIAHFIRATASGNGGGGVELAHIEGLLKVGVAASTLISPHGRVPPLHRNELECPIHSSSPRVRSTEGSACLAIQLFSLPLQWCRHHVPTHSETSVLPCAPQVDWSSAPTRAQACLVADGAVRDR
eukprot:5258405-Pleurochrysis_carterae.AAC.1